MRKSLWLSMLLIAVVLILPTACKAPAEPAKFEITSLNVTPPEVTVGDMVTITTEVKNSGGSEGVYVAILTVDGAEVERKNVTVAPGTTETVTFSLTKDKIGTYQVAVGGLSSSLKIEPRLVAKEVELKYDDGAADGFSSVSGGYLVGFMPPAVPFSIKRIRLFGTIRGAAVQNTFEVEIWDKEHKSLYSKAYPATMFPLNLTGPGAPVKDAAWVEIELPNTVVSDMFYIHVWKGPETMGGIHLGVDDNVKNEHSSIAVRAGGVTKEVESWGQPYLCTCWSGDKSKTNWMIRVVGTTMVPEE